MSMSISRFLHSNPQARTFSGDAVPLRGCEKRGLMLDRNEEYDDIIQKTYKHYSAANNRRRVRHENGLSWPCFAGKDAIII